MSNAISLDRDFQNCGKAKTRIPAPFLDLMSLIPFWEHLRFGDGQS